MSQNASVKYEPFWQCYSNSVSTTVTMDMTNCVNYNVLSWKSIKAYDSEIICGQKNVPMKTSS